MLTGGDGALGESFEEPEIQEVQEHYLSLTDLDDNRLSARHTVEDLLGLLGQIGLGDGGH